MEESSESIENAEEEGEWTSMGAELEKGFLDDEDE